jgi:hypothetical protein
MGAISYRGANRSGPKLAALLLVICLISVDNYAAYHTPAGKAQRDESPAASLSEAGEHARTPRRLTPRA